MKIDAHIHFLGDEADSIALLERLDLKLVNITVAAGPVRDWRATSDAYKRLAQSNPEHYAWCTSFELPRFDDPNYVDQAIRGLERDFEQGAIACKVWKNIGMEVRKPSGEFMMVDDPLLDPIFDYLARRDMTLLAHIGEPRACWEPLVPGRPHYGYYSQNPEWHMYGKTGVPSHADLIAARDSMVAKHPNLRVVGAHLGSLEYDVMEIAERFDRYPNFAVDMSTRLHDMTYQDTQTVREWFIKYQDRILYGTDIVMLTPCSSMTTERKAAVVKSAEETFAGYFQYLESNGIFALNGREVQGLGLPPDVLDKIYTENALKWYPALQGRNRS